METGVLCFSPTWRRCSIGFHQNHQQEEPPSQSERGNTHTHTPSEAGQQPLLGQRPARLQNTSAKLLVAQPLARFVDSTGEQKGLDTLCAGESERKRRKRTLFFWGGAQRKTQPDCVLALRARSSLSLRFLTLSHNTPMCTSPRL